MRKFNARYILLEKDGNRSWKNIDITTDTSRATLYQEEKQMKRVSNMISNLTGYPAGRIELRELIEL